MDSGTKILIVEDERIMAEDLKGNLENMGYQVTGIASTGKDAIRNVRKHRPDLVLMDIVIKGPMNGIGTADQIRTQWKIPIIYLTAYADQDTLDRAKLTEPFGYILKPYDQKDLQSTIEMALYRHSMEKQLRDSQVRFSTILRSIGDGVIVTDLKGRITFMNQMAESLTGWGVDEVVGKPMDKVFNPVRADTGKSDHPAFPKLVREMTGPVLFRHTLLATRDGRKIPIDENIAPLKDERDKPAGLVFAFHDVLEREIVEAALRESEERYRTLFEDSNDAIFIVTRQGKFVIANPSTLELFGISREDIGKSHIQNYFVDPEAWKQFQTGIEDRGALRDFEVKLRNSKKAELDCLLTSSIRKDIRGEILGYQGIIRDITQRKLVEEALKIEKAYLEQLFESSLEAVVFIDNHSRILRANIEFTRMFGYSLDEVINRRLDDLIAPKDLADEAASLIGRIISGENVSTETIRQRRDGERIHVSILGGPIKIGETQVALLGIYRDITERKEAEKDRERMHAQLLQAQKMEAIGILAGGVAHDFNNLLTVIQGNVDLSLMKMDSSNILYHDLKEVQSASVRAADLTRQLLMFSRKHPMNMIPLKLNRTIESLIKMLHRLIGEDITIVTDLDPKLWTIRADSGTMEQAVMNIAVNARDAMPAGGRLTLRTENVVVDEDGSKADPGCKPGRYIRLFISDTGVGMDEETQQHLFEPFFSTKGPGKGTGLGLSVVYGIVEQHNGFIRVQSGRGKGSTFTLMFPAVAQEPRAAAEEGALLSRFRGKGQKVLIVEDDDNVREFTTRALSMNGYRVVGAGNAEKGLEIFRRERGRFRLVLSDVVLPGQNGIVFVSELLKRKPGLKILLTSGYTDHKSQWPVIVEKGFRFLEKPYSLIQLLKTVHDLFAAP